MADAISIEETNKVRIAIGLKPLPVPGDGPTFKDAAASSDDDSSSEEEASTLETRQAQGYENWKKLQEEADAKAKREARNNAIRKARDAAQRNVKLEGKGLGDASDNEEDTMTWMKRMNKRQKQIQKERARKFEEEQAEREREAEYTSKDLSGVKVAHEIGDFDEGGEQVLTLKDTTIDENEEEGDELENLSLRERERLSEKLELKKKKPVYNPHENEGGNILSHYDEEIDGKKRKRFTLDGEGATEEQKEAMRQGVSAKLKSAPISLDILQDIPQSDYVDTSEIKMKKPKKKKPKSTRRKAADEDDIFPAVEANDNNGAENGDSMEIDSASTPVPQKRKVDDTSFLDDEDLQASLAMQRRAALKKRKKTKPEDIARQLREEASATPAPEQDDDEDGEPGLVIDETSEFVANLQRPTIDDTPRRRSSSKPTEGLTAMSPEPKDEDAEGDVNMQPYAGVEDEEEIKERLKRESSARETPDMTTTGLEEETTLNSGGIGATLRMLAQRNLIHNSETGDINALDRDRTRFLAEKRHAEEEAERKARLERERARNSAAYNRMSAREKEQLQQYENKQRDQIFSRQQAEAFKNYKPNVNLKYIDDHGREMNQKEAFKHLSHQFHGKGSGKQKTEKHLKKVEDEKKREAMSSLDASQERGMNNAAGLTARKNRQAGVRLA